MATIGKIEEFSPEDSDFVQYVERMEQFFIGNDIEDEGKKKAIFLSLIGAKCYKLVRNLVSPTKPADKDYKSLVEVLTKHFNPVPLEAVQRLKFNSRVRKEGESIADFIAALRHLAEDCNHGAGLDIALMDRIICGVNDDRIQRRLLSEKNITLKKAVEVSLGMEAANKNIEDIRSGVEKLGGTAVSSSKDTNFVKTKRNYHNKPIERDRGHGMGQADSRKDSDGMSCYRCGGKHYANDCRYKTTKCYNCQKIGHIKWKCQNPSTSSSSGRGRNQFSGRQKKQYTVSREDTFNSVREGEDYDIYTVKNRKSLRDPVMVEVTVNQTKIEMIVDTGAAVTAFNESTAEKIRTESNTVAEIEKSAVTLIGYSGESIPVAGKMKVTVNYEGQTEIVEAFIVKGNRPNLLGRDWLSVLKLNWKELFSVKECIKYGGLDLVLEKHSEVFKPGLGTLVGTKAKIYVDKDATPLYYKARPVPYAIKSKIEEEFNRLESEGIVSKVHFAEWAAPIVPIVKQNKSIRICGDYKVTVNKVSKLDNYPIPKTEDLLAVLGAGKIFSKLDLSQAYQQIELDDDSKKYVVINTHKGLYMYNRLPYGVSSAPGIFQRTMENVLQGLDNVIVRVDDILISGKNDNHHLEVLDTVLKRLEHSGLRLNKEKCSCMVDVVEYCGQRISANGIQPIPGKKEAVLEAPAPKDVQQLQSYLGMLNFYHKYLPDIATVLAPLHILLQKNKPWIWGKAQQTAFDKSKKLLLSAAVLTHYDSGKDIVITCDASPYGVGAVLAHKCDGHERPISFASRSLSNAEKNYSQLDKEGLALVFAVKKFHTYIYGKRFTMFTDHKPLLGLFGENKPIPNLASGRIQRWSLTLAAYEYSLQFRPGKLNTNSDALSRLPLSEGCNPDFIVPVPGEVILAMEVLDNSLVTAADVKKWTSKNSLLCKVMRYSQYGSWPVKCASTDPLFPFWIRRDEISIHDHCLLWGSRVIIPPQGRRILLENLHETHPGIVRMKALARNYIYWPGIDKDIEVKVRQCNACQVVQGKTTRIAMHPWEYPAKPWSRLHIDYMGPFQNQMFLIVIDAYSKWIEVYPTSKSTSTVTIKSLKQAFATHGLPETIVSDNGTCFTSEEFKAYLRKHGIDHITSSPYHPSSNGLAERAVQIIKNGLKKSADLSKVLFHYRITPQTTTGLTPSELLMNRKLRSVLDCVYPNPSKRVRERQEQQKFRYDQNSKVKDIQVNDDIYVSNFGKKPNWIPGTVVSESVTDVHVRLNDDTIVRRHKDHIKPRFDPGTSEIVRDKVRPILDQSMDIDQQDDMIEVSQPAVETRTQSTSDTPMKNQKNQRESTPAKPVQRPARDRAKPKRFNDFVM